VLLQEEPGADIEIQEIHPSGAAGRDGSLQVGDVLVALNGWKCAGMTCSPLIRPLQVRTKNESESLGGELLIILLFFFQVFRLRKFTPISWGPKGLRSTCV